MTARNPGLGGSNLPPSEPPSLPPYTHNSEEDGDENNLSVFVESYKYAACKKGEREG